MDKAHDEAVGLLQDAEYWSSTHVKFASLLALRSIASSLIRIVDILESRHDTT